MKTIRFLGLELNYYPKNKPIRYRWFTEMRRENENRNKYDRVYDD